MEEPFLGSPFQCNRVLTLFPPLHHDEKPAISDVPQDALPAAAVGVDSLQETGHDLRRRVLGVCVQSAIEKTKKSRPLFCRKDLVRGLRHQPWLKIRP